MAGLGHGQGEGAGGALARGTGGIKGGPLAVGAAAQGRQVTAQSRQVIGSGEGEGAGWR